jgi:hypothetical protein
MTLKCTNTGSCQCLHVMSLCSYRIRLRTVLHLTDKSKHAIFRSTRCPTRRCEQISCRRGTQSCFPGASSHPSSVVLAQPWVVTRFGRPAFLNVSTSASDLICHDVLDDSSGAIHRILLRLLVWCSSLPRCCRWPPAKPLHPALRQG